jgi:hypothetical protein
MRWSDLPLDPSPRMLRQFSVLCVVFFGALAGWHGFVRGHLTLGWIFAGLAVTLGPVGLLAPKAIRPIFIGWLAVAFPIGWIVSRVMLILLYFGLVVPFGLFFRLSGRDILHLKTKRQSTYWASKPMPTEISSYFRQY